MRTGLSWLLYCSTPVRTVRNPMVTQIQFSLYGHGTRCGQCHTNSRPCTVQPLEFNPQGTPTNPLVQPSAVQAQGPPPWHADCSYLGSAFHPSRSGLPRS